MTDEQIEDKQKELLHKYGDYELFGKMNHWRITHENGEKMLDEFAKWMQSMSPRWVKASDSLPIKPDNYPYNFLDESEPAIVFINRVHSVSLLYYLSIGFSAKRMLSRYEGEGWGIENWEYLYEPPKTDNDGK